MSPQRLASVAAGASVLAMLGLAAPEAVGRVVGLELDATGAALTRLVCVSYLGLGLLNWMARGVTDARAWRAIAAGNAFGWGLSAVVATAAIMSGLGNTIAWSIVAVQVAFTLSWSLASLHITHPQSATSAAA